jgi:hypothetical protein
VSSARTYYEQGIAQSFATGGTTLPSSYLTSSRAAYGQNSQRSEQTLDAEMATWHINNGYEDWTEAAAGRSFPPETVSAETSTTGVPVRMPRRKVR